MLLLGAAGRMGREALRDLAQSKAVSQLVAADARVEKARTLVQALGDKGKIEVRAVDVSDSDSLVSLLREADLVVNCVGPFYKYGVGVVKAALEAGVKA